MLLWLKLYAILCDVLLLEPPILTSGMVLWLVCIDKTFLDAAHEVQDKQSCMHLSNYNSTLTLQAILVVNTLKLNVHVQVCVFTGICYSEN